MRVSLWLRRLCFYLNAISNHIYAGCYGCRVQINARSKLLAPGRFNCSVRLRHYWSAEAHYQAFLLHNSFLSCTERRRRKQLTTRWRYQPRISVLLPVYRVAPEHLAECLHSIEQQLYPHWELCAVEDGSGDAKIKAALRAFQARYPGQVRVQLKEQNQGITVTSQQALELASGEFIALLDHDDRLAPEALFEMVQVLNQQPETDWLYSDNDKIDATGRRCGYHPKPAWSPELLMSYNYVLHLSVVRRSLCLQAGGFRPGFEGSQDHDLYLRLAEQTDRVRHIPRVLYSWRQSAGSVALNPASKDYAYAAALRALDSALLRRGEAGRAVHPADSWLGSYRIERPLESICLDSVETICLDAGNVSHCDWIQAIEQSTANHVLLVSLPVRYVSEDVQRRLLSQLTAKQLAGISPKLVNPDGTVHHCGLAYNIEGQLLYPLRGQSKTESGHGAHGALPRNVGLLSPLAGLYKTSALRQVSHRLEAFTDSWVMSLAISLSLREAGYRLCVDGGVSLILTADCESPLGAQNLTQLWRAFPSLFDSGDPFYTSNLRQEPADFSVCS